MPKKIEGTLLFKAASGDNLIALPDATYKWKGKSYLYLADLPTSLKMELKDAAADLGGFQVMGNIVNAKYLDFISNFEDNEHVETIDTHDLRILVRYEQKTYLISEEILDFKDIGVTHEQDREVGGRTDRQRKRNKTNTTANNNKVVSTAENSGRSDETREETVDK